MTSNSELCEALLPWFSSCFGVDLESALAVADGANTAKILHKIDAEHFSDKFLASIKVKPVTGPLRPESGLYLVIS